MALIDDILNSQVIDGRVTSQSDREQITCLQKIIAIDKYLKETNTNVNNYYETTDTELGLLRDAIKSERTERSRADSAIFVKINELESSKIEYIEGAIEDGEEHIIEVNKPIFELSVQSNQIGSASENSSIEIYYITPDNAYVVKTIGLASYEFCRVRITQCGISVFEVLSYPFYSSTQPTTSTSYDFVNVNAIKLIAPEGRNIKFTYVKEGN